MGLSEIKAGAAYVEISAKNSQFNRGLQEASAKLKSFGAATMTAGVKIASIGAAGVGGFFLLNKIFADTGSNLVDMSDRTGVSVEALSSLGFAAGQSGTDTETLEKSLAKMQKTISGAEGGSKKAAAALDLFGVSAEELAGLSPDEQFRRLADGLTNIQDPAQRTSALMAVFGKSGTALAPLMKDGADGIRQLEAEAERLGLTWKGDNARAAEAFGDLLQTVWDIVKKLGAEIGGAILSDLNAFFGSAREIGAALIHWTQANGDLIKTVFRIAAGIATAGAAIAVLGGLVWGIGAAIGAVGAIFTGAFALISGAISTVIALLGAILSPVGLVVAALGGLAGYFLFASETGRETMGILGDAFGQVAEEGKTAFGAIGAALASGDLGAAAKVAWTFIKLEFQRGIGYLGDVWIDWKSSFLSIWYSVQNSLAKAWDATTSGLETAWHEVWDAVADAAAVLWTFLKNGWNTTIGFIKKAWVSFKGLFSEDVNVEAEVKRINKETEDANNGNNNQRDQRIMERERRRKAAEDRINRDWTGTNAELDAETARDQAANMKAKADALKASEEALANAKQEFNDAVANANPQGPDANLRRPQGPKRPENPADGLSQGLDQAVNRLAPVGTFNADVLGQIGADSLSGKLDEVKSAIQRVGEAADKTAKNTEGILKKKEGDPSFGE